MKNLYNICFMALLFISLTNTGWGQTTVFIDDFNRTSLSPGGTPSMTYITTLANGITSSIQSNYLRIGNGTGAENGISYVTGSASNYSIPYNVNLSENTDIITWTFNFKYNCLISSPNGISAGVYGAAIVLAGSDLTLTMGSGYAVIYGQSGTPDPIRLVKYSGGLSNSTSTNIISSGINDLSSYNNCASVRVTYNPNGDIWSLYIRDDNLTWSDPSSGVTNLIGTIMDDEYTNNNLEAFGFVWSHRTNTETTNSTYFDNFKVTIGTPNPTLSVNSTTLSNFSYVQGSGPSASQNYTLTGSNLNGTDVIITGSTNYEVSTDDVSFSPSITFTDYGFAIEETQIYVRLKAELTAGLYENEIISNSGGGATSVNVTVSGKVLSPEPTQQPTNLSFTNVGLNTMTINWTKAAGTNTIVLMKSGSAVNSNPIDGTTYTGNAVFGSGSQIETGNYVVYTGDLETIDVTGLNQSTNYYIALYSYNGSASLENYLITAPLTGNQPTSAPTFGWQISSTNTVFTIDFDNTVPNVNNGQFAGSGFTPNPTTGQLNSNTFKVNGLSDGNMEWGDSKTSGDFARGSSTGGVTTGGIYSFVVSQGNNALGIQPAGDDFTPGNIYLRIQNKTESTINSVAILYKVYVRNDEDKKNVIKFYYSTNDVTYNHSINTDLESFADVYKSPDWKCNIRSTTITGLSIANNEYLYIKWYGDEITGSGNMDEFALDDIGIIFNPSSTIPSLSGNFDEVIIDCNTKLSGNTTVDSTLTIRNGLLFLGSNLLTVNTRINLNDPGVGKMIVLDDGTNQGILKLRVKDIGEYYYFHIGDNDNYESVEYSPAYIKFNTGEFNNAYLTVSMKNEKHPYNNSTTNFINRYWTIIPEGITNYSYDIELFYTENDVEGDEQYMILGKYNAPVWQTYGSAEPSNNKLSTTGLTSFSDFTGGTQTGMPISLLGFSSSVNGRDVKLNWITENEENNTGFEVQKAESRSQETEWKNIGFIQGKGNSNEPVSYCFEDRNLSSGKYKYRLKQIDYNGNYEYFELENEVIIGVPKKFELAQNYPNPFNPVTNINFDLPESGLVSLKIFDLLGREVAIVVNEFKEAGYYTVQYNAEGLSSGIYFYRLEAYGNSIVRKLAVMK